MEEPISRASDGPAVDATASRKGSQAMATAINTTEKVLFTGKTHTTGGRDGAARSSDGFVDLKLKQPHPAAEQLFAAAWSACYIGAIELAAGQRKIKLPASPAVDAEIDLNRSGDAFF